jgi:hypothetical protein
MTPKLRGMTTLGILSFIGVIVAAVTRHITISYVLLFLEFLFLTPVTCLYIIKIKHSLARRGYWSSPKQRPRVMDDLD